MISIELTLANTLRGAFSGTNKAPAYEITNQGSEAPIRQKRAPAALSTLDTGGPLSNLSKGHSQPKERSRARLLSKGYKYH